MSRVGSFTQASLKRCTGGEGDQLLLTFPKGMYSSQKNKNLCGEHVSCSARLNGRKLSRLNSWGRTMKMSALLCSSITGLPHLACKNCHRKPIAFQYQWGRVFSNLLPAMGSLFNQLSFMFYFLLFFFFFFKSFKNKKTIVAWCKLCI